MNVWNSKLVRASQPATVTASGASKMLLGDSGGGLPTTIETSWDGGVTWQAVVFAAQGAGLLVHITNPTSATPVLLGPQVRFDADVYVMQED
jgi:hypothetical protein